MCLCWFCDRSQFVTGWDLNLLCRLELQKGIAERHQSEASAQRTRPWQYNRSSAVINMIFAALTSQEHIFLWVTLLQETNRSRKPRSLPLFLSFTFLTCARCSQSAQYSCKAYAYAQLCCRAHVSAVGSKQTWLVPTFCACHCNLSRSLLSLCTDHQLCAVMRHSKQLSLILFSF